MTTQRPAKKTTSKKETAKRETAPVPKNRYGNSRALLVVPSRDRSRCKTLTPWAEVDELDRGIMWAEATRMTDSARKKLRACSRGRWRAWTSRGMREPCHFAT